MTSSLEDFSTWSCGISIKVNNFAYSLAVKLDKDLKLSEQFIIYDILLG